MILILPDSKLPSYCAFFFKKQSLTAIMVDKTAICVPLAKKDGKNFAF